MERESADRGDLILLAGLFIVLVLLIVAASKLKMEIQDLQRRVAELEQRK